MTLQEMSAAGACAAVPEGPVVARCEHGWMLLEPTSMPELVVGTIGGVGDATAFACAVYEEVEAAAARCNFHVAVKGAKLGPVQTFDPLCLFPGEPEEALVPNAVPVTTIPVAISADRAPELVAIGDVMLGGWQGHLGLYPYCGFLADKVAEQRGIAQGAYDAAKALLPEKKRPCLF